jgi:hypothetical protein
MAHIIRMNKCRISEKVLNVKLNKMAGGRLRVRWDRYGRKKVCGMKLRWRRGALGTRR